MGDTGRDDNGGNKTRACSPNIAAAHLKGDVVDDRRDILHNLENARLDPVGVGVEPLQEPPQRVLVEKDEKVYAVDRVD